MSDAAPNRAPPPKIRLFVADRLSAQSETPLSRDAAHYLVNVMRLSAGAKLRAFNGDDGEWLVELAAASKRAATLRPLERLRPPEAPPDLWLLFAPVKKARTDFIVEKAAEMGCRRAMPVFTALTNSDRVNRDRLQAHAVEAAEQCDLVFVPEVAAPMSLEQALADWPSDRALFFCDERRGAPPLQALASSHPGPAAILIGPEGGFSAAEAAALRGRRFVHAASLGPRVLRADTAAAAAIALWQSVAGDWRGPPAAADA